MPDHDAMPDPVDKAYAQSEALLADQGAEAARRARVLAAVAAQPPAAQPGEAPMRRPSAWRRGGWLAAAGVAVFCAFLAGRLYQPVRDRTMRAEAPPPAAAAPVAPAAAAPPPATKVAVSTPRHVVRSRAVERPHATAKPPEIRIVTAVEKPEGLEPASDSLTPAPRPPSRGRDATSLVLAAPRLRRFPLPGQATQEVVVTGSRIARRDFTGPSQVMAMRTDATPLASLVDERAARLRAAATAGRVGDLEMILAEGVPVDAPDADGATALMRSVQADHPDAAALLRRYGANPDQRDSLGLSPRDIARSKNDPDLDRALGMDAPGGGPAEPRIGSQ